MRGFGNGLKTAVLLAALSGLMLMAGQTIGHGFGLKFAFGLVLVMNGVAYWFSDKIAILSARAKPVTEQEMPGYYAIVRRLTAKADLPMPKLYVIPSPQPNAFATGRNPRHSAVAVTQGILGILTEEELEGVIAHELSHVGNRDILISSIAATLAATITFLARLAFYAAIFGGGRDDEDRGSGIGELAFLILGPIAAMLIQLAVSRSREYQADDSGGRLCGKPLALASALAKLERGAQLVPVQTNAAMAHMYIVNPLRGRSMSRMFSTHPPTEERIARLQRLAQVIG
jgi:heat shock protein HtpX